MESKGFLIEELLTKEEIAIMRGIANGMRFNAKDINNQLAIARKNKYK